LIVPGAFRESAISLQDFNILHEFLPQKKAASAAFLLGGSNQD
jgi:hypothetical protein